ncbi:hypothetical protein [Agrococcus sp. SGAir0287]|uniref:hypothetical protein n=1 Tax=Agrococcus sp. SGAir0287 TaxID=2070347 RepID=UPI0010CD2E81|nr:hypothetical protein [Agrococcus sp. SGAir0287]QCR18854.1 hypothetical protein C1N71_04820 [Agrococcus sp. SGAir0287]
MDDVTTWLLEGDPGIRWQVMQDLLDAPQEEVDAERARVAHEGFGAALLAARGDDGLWAGGAWAPAGWSWELGEPQAWTSTSWVLESLCDLGMPADEPVMAETVELIARNGRWEYGDLPFWQGEVDSCINGRTIRAGARFGADVSAIVAYCEEDQQPDGGWNCFRLEGEGSTRSSFASTISVLEGLLEYQQRTGRSTAAMRERGMAYLLERSLLRGLRSGEIVSPSYLSFAFPPRARYDVLRALDHLRLAGLDPEPRMAEAIAIVRSKRQPDGRWLSEYDDPGAVQLHLDAPSGEPSRWNTLRALRVLRWADGG